GGREVLRTADRPLPLASLAAALGLADPGPPPGEALIPVVRVTDGLRTVALRVDALLDHQDVLVKRLGPRLDRLRLVMGATVLASGRVATILEPTALLEAVLAAPILEAPEADEAPRAVRVLVVDDSVTTRSLLKSILETEGYVVRVASDGDEAWE